MVGVGEEDLDLEFLEEVARTAVDRLG
jgi:hypothetical protein